MESRRCRTVFIPSTSLFPIVFRHRGHGRLSRFVFDIGRHGRRSFLGICGSGSGGGGGRWFRGWGIGSTINILV
jgi:hypothetical protein